MFDLDLDLDSPRVARALHRAYRLILSWPTTPAPERGAVAADGRETTPADDGQTVCTDAPTAAEGLPHV